MTQNASRNSDPFDAPACAEALLRWYDARARVLPWRVPPGSDLRPDPYLVWLSEIMLQQTTVAAVKAYFHRFTVRWPDVQALAAASDADVLGEWAGLGYYARARNLLACARLVAARGGFPDTLDGLRALPGIGPYTAAAIASIAFGRAETVVDGNVERVVSRLWAVQDPLPGVKKTLVALAERLTPASRAGDHAQAMMDLGATICTPRGPRCGDCPVAGFCQGREIAASLPVKSPKAPKPTRRGIVYVAQRPDGAVLTETRPAKGLLGGMIGFPGSDWAESPVSNPPVTADWHMLPGEVRHTFTHFHLVLTVAVTTTDTAPMRGSFDPAFDPGALPTVMRKCWDHAASAQLAGVGLPG